MRCQNVSRTLKRLMNASTLSTHDAFSPGSTTRRVNMCAGGASLSAWSWCDSGDERVPFMVTFGDQFGAILRFYFIYVIVGNVG
jgi:hypothetical protein